jgi:hypothetical protein
MLFLDVHQAIFKDNNQNHKFDNFLEIIQIQIFEIIFQMYLKDLHQECKGIIQLIILEIE